MVYEFDGFQLDLDSHSLRRAGVIVPVEPQVFDVLALLVRNRSRTVTKEELLDQVWGDRFVSESALTSRIKAARRAVADDGRAQRVIRTVHGRGYQFVAPLDGEQRQPSSGEGASAGLAAPRTRYARSGPYSIAYQVVGDGPEDIVFVPGFVSHLDLQWELPAMASFFERLAEGRRLIIFDKRGTGLSDRVPPDRLPTIEERMDDVRAVMDDVGSDAAAIVGISEGGPMSLLFAASHPDRVSRMALFGTFVHEPLGPDTDLVERTRKWWGSGTSYGHLAPSWSRDQALRRFMARYERASATPDAASVLVDLCNRVDVRGVLPAVSVPTMVLHRRGDSVFPLEGAHELAAGISECELVELDGTDHLVFVDHAPVLDAVLGFLDGSGGQGVRGTERVLTTLVFVSVDPDRPTAADLDPAVLERALDDAGAPGARSGTRAREVDGGVVAMVDGPARAIRAALSLVEAEGPGAGEWRVAVHTSEVEIAGGAPGGPGVAIVRGVGDAAAPGDVLVTRTVRDLVVGAGLEFTYVRTEPLGTESGRWELFRPATAEATSGSW